ncbi:galactose oxidase [Artomyces pyxidatus]|uniref:Galactose oxidase n=1 Tax=Artomyces pyxidatus TaxID=48021 RepID=A0ACB8T492_9AGAM|nr:galactose oxidase [Artomyces pyxidatus]
MTAPEAPAHRVSNRSLRSPAIRDITLPEERPLTPPASSPVLTHRSSSATHHSTAPSTSALKPTTSARAPTGPRGPSSSRRSQTDSGHTDVSSVRRLAAANASSTSLAGTKDGGVVRSPKPSTSSGELPPRIRTIPHLPHVKDAEPAPASVMYWSKAPVWGTLPTHAMRAHSVTLVDTLAWIFGGCDDKGCWKDVWTFNIETMQWSRPEMQGDLPPPCRAHSATLVDRKIVIFGGGEGPVYYNSVYVLDIAMRRWSKPQILNHKDDIPPPRRAHTTVLYQGKIWVFGGGNGMQALNDVWTLDVSGSLDKVRWEQVTVTGRKKPSPRGYHTANLVGNVMIVVGGSDGRECFSDIWCLNLDTLIWTQIRPEVAHRRLSHAVSQVGSFLFITGGHDGTEYTQEMLMFNLVSLQYEPRRTLGKPPSPRGYHITILADSRLFIFGGFNGHDVYDDVHILELAAAAYLPQVTSFSIEA